MCVLNRSFCLKGPVEVTVGTVRTTTPEHGTKNGILRIAAELFARNGYHATGMTELSNAVNLGRGALYYHIGSKEAVLFEISKRQVARLIEEAQRVVTSAGSPPEKLQILARDLMENIASHRSEWTVFFREYSGLTGAYRSEIMGAREIYEGLWHSVLRDGADKGFFKQLSPLLVKGILGMYNYSYLWIKLDGMYSPAEIADQFTGVILDGLLVEGSARDGT